MTIKSWSELGRVLSRRSVRRRRHDQPAEVATGGDPRPDRGRAREARLAGSGTAVRSSGPRHETCLASARFDQSRQLDHLLAIRATLMTRAAAIQPRRAANPKSDSRPTVALAHRPQRDWSHAIPIASSSHHRLLLRMGYARVRRVLLRAARARACRHGSPVGTTNPVRQCRRARQDRILPQTSHGDLPSEHSHRPLLRTLHA